MPVIGVYLVHDEYGPLIWIRSIIALTLLCRCIRSSSRGQSFMGRCRFLPQDLRTVHLSQAIRKAIYSVGSSCNAREGK